ncbi:MAG: glycosyltransferase family 4 protein [Chitinophagaceae bacterium]
MTIAIDITHTGDNHFDEYISLPFRLLKRVVTKNPGHEFIFISGRPMQTKLLFDNNVTVVETGPQIRNNLLTKIWYDIKIPALLRKYRADVFIAANGICFLNTCPLCLIVNDLSFLHSSSPIKKASLFFLKRETKKNLDKAKSIVTFSEFVKKEIVSKFGTSKEKITVVPPAGKESFYPLVENEKEVIRIKYTGGKNYFLYTGVSHLQKNLINLLRAFAVFKKRQKSDWKLVLAGSLGRSYKNFAIKLRTYKYRDDVVMTGHIEEKEIINLTASAYSFIYPAFWESNGLEVLGPMKSHIPVITSVNSPMQEIAGDAALYVDPADHFDIADKMMLIYKDESLRNSLIEKGKIVALQYNLEKTSDLLWQCILKACPDGQDH